MKNFAHVTLISLFVFTGLSFAGEKVEVPELPDFTKWMEGPVSMIRVPLKGEEVEIKIAIFVDREKGELIRLYHDIGGKSWFIYYLFGEEKVHLYENIEPLDEGVSWQFVVDMTGWDGGTAVAEFINKRYGFTFPIEGQR